MELSQVKYFIIAAQTQNLSKAAQILNITQSALSKSISILEDELGVLLFDRSGKRITINKNGKIFLEHAMNSVQELESAVTAVKSRVERPALYLGLFHHSEKFMKCLKDFSALNPNVMIHLDYLEIASFRINTNDHDMLLFPQIPLFREYRADAIYSDPYLLAVHKSNLLSLKPGVFLSDLAEQNMIFIRFGDNLFDLPYHLCINMEIGLNNSVFTNSFEIQRWLISNNHGVGFVPRGGSDSYANDPNIALMPVMDQGFSQEIMIGFKKDKHISAIGRQFAAFVQGYCFDG